MLATHRKAATVLAAFQWEILFYAKKLYEVDVSVVIGKEIDDHSFHIVY